MGLVAGGRGGAEKEKIPHMCESIGHRPLRGRWPKKGGAAFNVIGERLVLSSNADLAFTNGAEKMLKDKE